LRAWRAARSTHRAVAIRSGSFVLSEWRSFDLYEAVFSTPDAARWAIAAGEIDWQLVKRAAAKAGWNA